MSRIYINLHPDYDYATAIIQEGFIPILRDYVKYVDWLHWDFPNRRQIMISGHLQEIGSHISLKRVQTFIQRMTDIGVEIQVRDNRGDEWRNPEFEKLSDEEMLDIELLDKENETKNVLSSLFINSVPFYSKENMEELERRVADAKAGRNMHEHELIELE